MKKLFKCSISIDANKEFQVKNTHQRHSTTSLASKLKYNLNKLHLFHQFTFNQKRHYNYNTNDIIHCSSTNNDNTEYPVITTGFIRPQVI